MTWTPASIPDLTGKTAVVTGANSGIGLPTALELTRHGARVVVAARSPEKGRAAVAQIAGEVPGAQVEYGRLDLADLASVREFAAGVDTVDLLINNAGVLSGSRQETKDGFELQFGTNHLGHFALTGLLLPKLLARPGARVVTVSSDAHAAGRIDFDDLGLERKYSLFGAYGRSKLANLLFMYELKRRAEQAGADLVSVATHPGVTATNIVKLGPFQFLMGIFMKSASAGAVPSLYAATSPDIRGGEFIGPRLKRLTPSRTARSEEVARRLWEVSTELTGVRFEEIAYS
ncbi:oxidoreductase [Nonomuraea sp. SYSU D8015]|uniref:oxidoreductase n=1 Tax=Nonomuraea sp. SYSU D8015 TaxID=2593644 RepID=UPI0016609327|nr:oxidoreductase [Nonomuraea sp. SYSU D8015]